MMTRHKQSKDRKPLVRAEQSRAVDRGTVLKLLQACVANELRCVAEIVRYSRTDPVASRGLLEDLLAMKDGHARDLLGVLQHHHVAAH
jgi:hypothetical protein